MLAIRKPSATLRLTNAKACRGFRIPNCMNRLCCSRTRRSSYFFEPFVLTGAWFPAMVIVAASLNGPQIKPELPPSQAYLSRRVVAVAGACKSTSRLPCPAVPLMVSVVELVKLASGVK